MRYTLKDQAAYQAAHRGRWRPTPYGMVVISHGAETAYGVVVTKKLGNAVLRNTMKRKARAALVPLMAALPPGTVILLRPTPALAAASSEDLRAALQQVLLTSLAAGRS